MKFLFSLIGISFYFLLCDCKKLTCNDVVQNENVNKDFKVNFKFFGIDSNGNLTKVKFSPSLDSTYFDPTRKTIVVIHGFTNTYKWIKLMAKEWLKRELVNFISVQRKKYGPIAIYQYRKAALESEHIAFLASQFMLKLIKENKENMNMDFHFVGHSLGTHIAGQTARLLKKNGIIVQRLTALDPAYPCFEDDSAELRLKKTDTEFMDVIHTNSEPGEKNIGNYGTYDPIGHMDFYVNGGDNQPGCTNAKSCNQLDSTAKSMECYILSAMKKSSTIAAVSSFALKQVIEYDVDKVVKNMMNGKKITCEHEESIYYFIDSLDPHNPKMWGNPTTLPIKINEDLEKKNEDCDSETCVEMGINAELYKTNSSGVFYVKITED